MVERRRGYFERKLIEMASKFDQREGGSREREKREKKKKKKRERERERERES